MSSRGVVYVAYGERARGEAVNSIASLRALHPDLPVVLLADEPLAGVDWQYVEDCDPAYRLQKLSANEYTFWDYTLYLDADTRILQPLDALFAVLADGWDIVLTPSKGQGRDFLWHVRPEERHQTEQQLAGATLQLQGGVFGFRRGRAVDRFFAAWREEWGRYGEQDQAALLRALKREPVRVWLLGRPWNGGAIIQHRFGAAAAGPKTRPRILPGEQPTVRPEEAK